MGVNNSTLTHEECNSSETFHENQPLLAQFHGYDHGGTPKPFPTAPVTGLVKEARYAIINALDTSLSRKELGSPEIYFALLLPIVRRYREERRETAAVYCFLLNRWQFLKDAESDLANARLNETRAHACEIVATKVLKAFTMRQLIDVLTYDFSPVRRKDRSRLYLPHFDSEPSTEPMSALEVAISGRAKNFISNSLVQEIINQIWLGEIVFFSNAIDNPRSCLHASQQEIRTVTVYDNRHIKFLRLSRLRVPRYKTTFQMVSFSVFIFVYTVVIFEKRAELAGMEVIMDVFALSYTLDEFLQLKDSGPSSYFGTVWNLFDVPIYIIFLVFMVLRIITFFTKSNEMSNFAYDFLACNSILLWPRLFAALDHYKFFGTMLIVLRQMLLDAMLFIALSFIFYVGFLQAFYVLHDNTKSYGEIAWLLLQVFFGSAFLGFEQAQEISKLFGAPLMVLFVAISVLMLYTLLISIFSQTFSEVSANAKEEFMFLFSVKVMEEVKSDALYEFQPPFNILAGIFIWPCRLLYPPEVVGKLSRVLLRFFYFPELVCIWLFETLVLSKKPPYVPVRPGHVEHHGTYNSASSVPEYEDGSVGDGVAGQRQEERSNNGTMKNSILGSFPEVITPSPVEPQRLSEEPHEMGATHPPDPSFKTQQHQRQQPDRLNTNELSSSAQEILSPYFESIRKYRNANKNNPSVVTAPATRNDSEGGSEHPQYSYYASAPIGLGAARQGSISGYRRSRRGTGTEATLANTYQGVSSSYHNAATGGDLSSLIGDSLAGDHYSHHQFHDQHPQQQHDDIEELALLMETRHAEMRIRMDHIESKLDQLLFALTNNNQNGK